MRSLQKSRTQLIQRRSCPSWGISSHFESALPGDPGREMNSDNVAATRRHRFQAAVYSALAEYAPVFWCLRV